MVAVPVNYQDVEYVTITGVDPEVQNEVIAAIRVLVPYGLAKAKYVGAGSTEDPDYAWELSTADELTRLVDLPGGQSLDTNITTGVVNPAGENRTIDFGGFSASFSNVSTFNVAGPVNAPQYEIASNGNVVTLKAPATLGSTYDVVTFASLPDAGQVGNNENYVRVDENGNLTYGAAVGTGQGTNLSLGTRTAETMEVLSSTGNPVDLLKASTTEAGLVTATQFDEIEKIPNLPTEDTSITTGTLAAATAVRNVDLNGNNLNFLNLAATTFDNDISVTGSVTATSLAILSNTQTVTQTAPATLAASYGVEWMATLPTAGDVSGDANWLRIDDAGLLTYGAPPKTVDTSITTGTLVQAGGNRSPDFGGFALNFLNASQITMVSAGPISLTTALVDVSGAVQTPSLDLVQGGQTVKLVAPDPAVASYTAEMFDALPSAQAVSDNENFLRVDSTGKLYYSIPPGGTPGGGTTLSLVNRTATTYDVASDTGGDATLLPATATLAGLMTDAQFNLVAQIPSLPTEDSNITTGTVDPPTANRTISFGNFNLTFDGLSNYQVTSNNVLLTNGTGTSIGTSSGDVVLNAEGQIFFNSDVDAQAVTVHVGRLDLDGGTNNVSLISPSALGAAYTVEMFDALPSSGDVTAGDNFLRVNDAGKLYFGSAGGGGGTGTDVWEQVAVKANRSTPDVVGFRSQVVSNQTTYVWDGGQYLIDAAEKVGTTAERAALSEVEDDFVWHDKTLGKSYRYDSAEDPPWVEF
jgi:hypothetical protein